MSLGCSKFCSACCLLSTYFKACRSSIFNSFSKYFFRCQVMCNCQGVAQLSMYTYIHLVFCSELKSLKPSRPADLRLQYTFASAIFHKFGFLGQNSGWRIISNFWKKILKKAKYWWRNGGFTFSPEVKVYLLIDSPMARMQSTETIFARITYMDVMNWLLSWSALLFWLPSIFGIRRVSIKL